MIRSQIAEQRSKVQAERRFKREDRVAEQTSTSLEGTIAALRLRVNDADRAARFFGALLGAEATRLTIGAHAEQWFVARSPLVSDAIDVGFTDDPRAPPQRVLYVTPDPQAALTRAVSLGGAGTSVSEARDNQGLPIGFHAPGAWASGAEPGAAKGARGVLLLQVPDTVKARAFQYDLFGAEFHRVGEGDFWWANRAPPTGVFPIDHDMTNSTVPLRNTAPHVRPFFCVGELEPAMAAVRRLRGETFSSTAVGPFRICGCCDDQALPFGLWWDPSR
jgi:predicted enzyme related to lactoylglutathione lyase